MYWFGCHRFVAMYISTDCFIGWITARINSRELRTNRGTIWRYVERIHGAFNTMSQKVKPCISTSMTTESDHKKCQCTSMKLHWYCGFVRRRTWQMGVGIVVYPWINNGKDILRHIEEQENAKDFLGLTPHCVDTQNHHHCDLEGQGNESNRKVW